MQQKAKTEKRKKATPPAQGAGARAWARYYFERGWTPVPIPYKKKAPVGKDWQLQTVTLNNIDQYFPRDKMNVGVQMGPKSNGLGDSDLDCAEARALAPYFLPPTNAIFGRAGSPRSHWLYYVTDPEPVTVLPFKDKEGKDGIMINELRVGISGGAQSVFPGSVHEDTSEDIV